MAQVKVDGKTIPVTEYVSQKVRNSVDYYAGVAERADSKSEAVEEMFGRLLNVLVDGGVIEGVDLQSIVGGYCRSDVEVISE